MDAIKLSGYADFEWAVQLNRFSLNLMGLWPHETSTAQRSTTVNLRLIGIFVAIIFMCTIPSLSSLVMVWGDLTSMIDNMMFTIPMLTVPVKILILWWKKRTLSPLINMIIQDWIKPKSKDERDVMIRYAQNARLIILCSYILIFSTLLILIVTCGFGYALRFVTNATDNNGRPLPIQAQYIYDTSVSPQFEITFLVQSVLSVIIAICYAGIDNCIGLLICHICGQLENLICRLYRMRESDDFIAALTVNVKDHIRLIKSVAIIEDIFTLMLMLAFVFFSILFCVYGFLLAIILEEKNISFKKIIFLIMAVFISFTHTGIYCAAGELLIMKFEEVYNAVYEYEWYTLQTKEAKNLIFLMIRMRTPPYITAGKMFPMTMSTFCNILKTSGGYVSVLLANRH